jgi:hypothetical protein
MLAGTHRSTCDFAIVPIDWTAQRALLGFA